MAKYKKIVEPLMEALKDYNAVNVDYGNDQVVGVANDVNGCDLVVYINAKEITVTFGYHSAVFSKEDVDGVITHCKNILSGEYASVEFFSGEKKLFGGLRQSSTCKFKTVDDVLNCYASGDEGVFNNITNFIKNNQVNVMAISFDNKVSTLVSVNYKDNEFKLDILK